MSIIRLHQTAPRERLSDAAHGEPMERMGPLGGVAHRVRSCFPGNVHRGLSGRAAPLVSRNR